MHELTERGYWDEVWKADAPTSTPPRSLRLWRYRQSIIPDYFLRHLPRDTEGKTVIELGCGNSVFLPLLARDFKMRVTGLDYSERGCELTRQKLAAAKIEAEIVCADLLAPPANLLGVFDYVCSFGLVEHFDDLPGVLATVAGFAKPGGTIITSMPNLAGLLGRFQRHIGPKILAAHHVWTAEELAAHLRGAGLVVSDCSYLAPLDVGMCNVDADAPRYKHAAYRLLHRGASVAHLAHTYIHFLPANRLTAAYIYAVATKPR